MAANSVKGVPIRRRTGAILDRPDDTADIRRYGEDEIPSTDDHPVVDLRGYVTHVYEQGDLGSCTTNAVCTAYGLLLQKQAREMNHVFYDFSPSRLFVYYNARAVTNKTDEDIGASVQDALRSLKFYGACQEDLWPYRASDFDVKPSPDCYTEAKGHKLTQYERLTQDKHQLRACLKEGFPFAFIFAVYDRFEFDTGADGVMPVPSAEELQDGPIDLHGVLCVGYNDNTQCFTVLNSWGTSFGDGGCFYMPYNYILDTTRAHNFWKLSQVKELGLSPTK